MSQHGFSDVVNLSGYDLDPARLAAQVVSGISFIGAGMIIVRKEIVVEGLTSAAGLWATAGIGLAIGGGLYLVGIVTSALILFAFTMSDFISKKMDYRKIFLEIVVTNEKKLDDLYSLFNKNSRYLKQYRLEEKKRNKNKINSAQFTVEVKNKKDEKVLLEEIQNMEETIIKEINYMDI